jgi:inactivated superfamily I helicase
LHSRFPADPIHAAQWTSKIKLKSESVKKWHIICGLHFSEDMYAQPKNTNKIVRRKLKKTAIPDLNLGNERVRNSDDYRNGWFDVSSIIVCERQQQEKTIFQLVETAELASTSSARPAKRSILQKRSSTAAAKAKVLSLRRKTLLQRVRRLSNKNNMFKSMLHALRTKNMLNKDAEQTLLQLYASPAGTIIENQVKNLKKKKQGLRYDEELRAFALSVHYHSEAAYQVLR